MYTGHYTKSTRYLLVSVGYRDYVSYCCDQQYKFMRILVWFLFLIFNILFWVLLILWAPISFIRPRIQIVMSQIMIFVALENFLKNPQGDNHSFEVIGHLSFESDSIKPEWPRVSPKEVRWFACAHISPKNRRTKPWIWHSWLMYIWSWFQHLSFGEWWHLFLRVETIFFNCV